MSMKRMMLAAAMSALLATAGCTSMGGFGGQVFSSAYGPIEDQGYALPRIPADKIERKYHRQLVSYPTSEKPGTIIVDTNARFLYFVMEDGQAIRYGIGVGREGFEWSGTAKIGWKREWPKWTPPKEMIERDPKLAKYAGGMDPGLTNPLGARALYLTNKGGDTGYRLHGTPEWQSIGKAMSSGCIRLMNQDIIDLYNRAKPGAKVIVV